MARKKKGNKKISEAYYKTCSGIAISVMDMGKVVRHGEQLLAEGADTAALETGIRAFVETIRKD